MDHPQTDSGRNGLTDDERRARVALIGSFFFPPWGVLHGGWLLFSFRGTPFAGRALARLALLNGLVGTAVVIKFVLVAPELFRWVLSQWEGV